jgi:hypothetical protein
MKKTKINHNESVSLWNYTLSPGWSRAEVEVLKLALQKFGIGKWSRIIKSKCLPGKSIGQIYLQTQRIMGQQSLGDFMGLHVDIERVFIDNSRKQGVVRKNNCIINTGDNPNKIERAIKINENREKYGITEAAAKEIKLPKKKKSLFEEIILLDEIETNKFSTVEKIEHLKKLLKLVSYKLHIMDRFGKDYFEKFTLQGPNLIQDSMLVKRSYFKDSNPTLNTKLEDFLKKGKPHESAEISKYNLEEEMYNQYLKKVRRKPAPQENMDEPVLINLKKVSQNKFQVTEMVN